MARLDAAPSDASTRTERVVDDRPDGFGLRRGGVRLGRIAGIEIDADWSVLVVVWLITWSLADTLLPASRAGYSTQAYWLVAIATAVLFVAALATHELSHSLVAIRRGVPVHDIRLWVLGGIASIEREPENPRDDFAIAAAGPAASIVIGAVALGVAGVLHAFGTAPLLSGALEWLGSINLLLAAFNLIPAAPLDGGRLLRSLLWRRHGDRTRAAVQAAAAGQMFAGALIALGLLSFFGGATLQGVWFAFLGWFLLNAARAEEMQATLRHDFASLRASDLMSAPVVTVPSWASVADVLDQFVLVHRCSAFPLLDDDGALRGLVTLDDVRPVAAAARETTPALDVAVPVGRIPMATPQTPAIVVLERLATSVSRRVLVVDDDARPAAPGNLVGIITPTDVARIATLAQSDPRRARARVAARLGG